MNSILNHRIRGAAILIILLLLSACSPALLMQKTAPVSRYLLEWNDTQAVSTAARNTPKPSIRLSAISAAAGFDGPQIIYVRTPYRLEHYAYHRWGDTPARMLEPLLMRMLEGSGLFSAVVGPDTAVRANLRLDAELLHLQQVFKSDDSKSSEVQLALSVSLVDIAQARLIGSRTFSITEPVTDPTPYGSVQAANRATARLLVALRNFLDRLQPFPVDAY